MVRDDPRPQRHEEVQTILKHKSGAKEIGDKSDRYTAIGPVGRETFAN